MLVLQLDIRDVYRLEHLQLAIWTGNGEPQQETKRGKEKTSSTATDGFWTRGGSICRPFIGAAGLGRLASVSYSGISGRREFTLILTFCSSTVS